MSSQLTSYPAYKPTGLPWLPQIPEHWEMLKIKYAFRERCQKGYPEEPLLAATQNHGVIPKTLYETRTVTAQKDLHLLKLVKNGDFVISLRSFQGGIEYAYYQGIISPAYTVMIPYASGLQTMFFKYLAKSKAFVKLLQTCVTGIREGQNIDYEALRRNAIPIPTPGEQTQIVRYLDSMTAKINKLIRAKKKQIALLQEQKQAIINQAVTKGLNPDAEMKDSGVWWIGKTPAHWQKIPVKGIAKFINGFAFASDSFIINYTFPVVRIGDICDNGDINFNCPLGVEDDNKLDDFIIKEGDILIAMSGATTGKVGIAKGVRNKSFINQRVGIIRSANCQYLYYCLSDRVFQEYVTMLSAGSAQPNLSGEGIKNYQIMWPTPSEISEITSYIDKKCTAIDAAISEHKAAVSALQEYKNSLVSLVVTGQIDVRNIPVDDFDPADLVAESEDDPEEEEDTINESEG